MYRNIDADISSWRKFWQNCTDINKILDNLEQIELLQVDVDGWLMELERLHDEYEERLDELEEAEMEAAEAENNAD